MHGILFQTRIQLGGNLAGWKKNIELLGRAQHWCKDAAWFMARSYARQDRVQFDLVHRLGVTIVLDDFHDGGFEGQYRLEFWIHPYDGLFDDLAWTITMQQLSCVLRKIRQMFHRDKSRSLCEIKHDLNVIVWIGAKSNTSSPLLPPSPALKTFSTLHSTIDPTILTGWTTWLFSSVESELDSDRVTLPDSWMS